MTTARAGRSGLVFIIVITCVKLASAYLYPGFFSGDDVEIHEMTFAKLFALDWPVWNIRSPFYPLVFVHPVQALVVFGIVPCGGAVVFEVGGWRFRKPAEPLAIARH